MAPDIKTTQYFDAFFEPLTNGSTTTTDGSCGPCLHPYKDRRKCRFIGMNTGARNSVVEECVRCGKRVEGFE